MTSYHDTQLPTGVISRLLPEAGNLPVLSDTADRPPAFSGNFFCAEFSSLLRDMTTTQRWTSPADISTFDARLSNSPTSSPFDNIVIAGLIAPHHYRIELNTRGDTPDFPTSTDTSSLVRTSRLVDHARHKRPAIATQWASDTETDAEVSGMLVNIAINSAKSIFERASQVESMDICDHDVAHTLRAFKFDTWKVAQEVRAVLFNNSYSGRANWLVLRWIGMLPANTFCRQALWICEHALTHSDHWVRDGASLALVDVGSKDAIPALDAAIQNELVESVRLDLKSARMQLHLL